MGGLGAIAGRIRYNALALFQFPVKVGNRYFPTV
jgi:hypothetical protein